MPSASPKRVAALAVRRYGADRLRVERECEEVVRAHGQADDLLEALVTKGLLREGQANELLRTIENPKTVLAPTPGIGETNPEDDDCPTLIDFKTNQPVLQVNEPTPLKIQNLGGFRILRQLGEGSMGEVYLGYHEAQNRQVAIKVLNDMLGGNPGCVERFYREAKSSGRLIHPNIVRGISVGRDSATGKHYLVREFVDGLSAQVLLDRLTFLPVGAAVAIALDVARALEYLQSRGYVHRDIKPDNILVTRSGQAKLADLGLVKRIGEAAPRDSVVQGFGTSYYMPYEQAMNAHRVDGRSDIYALGATLYHLLTGIVPFTGNNHDEIVQKKQVGRFAPASSINHDIPASLDTILNKMLAQLPEDRYQTARELVADLVTSGLAVPVANFPEAESALHDPLVQTIRDTANQPTRPDFECLMPTTTLPRLAASTVFVHWLTHRPETLTALVATLGLSALVGLALLRYLFTS
jgi:serine/threonine protein kinase